MKIKIILVTIILSAFIIRVFSASSDTIKVVMDLRQTENSTIKYDVHLPNDLTENAAYRFPKSIPGIYEYLNANQNFIRIEKNGVHIKGNDNTYHLSKETQNDYFTSFASNTTGQYSGMAAKDAYILKDSIYILNWHYIFGYFTDKDRPFKIEIQKNTNLFGSGSLSKKIINDTIDVFYAKNYKELIHNPVMYSIPDTLSFLIDQTKFHISCAGNDSLMNAQKIKELIHKPISEILSKSTYKHKEYTFLYFSEYSLFPPYLMALEHPNSTLVCSHSALLNNNILIGSSIHEFIHAIYSPLRIRSEIIDDFDFHNPKCDHFLWFYEGVTEYLTLKTLINSGFYEAADFFNEFEESIIFNTNINLSKISADVYGKKGQKQFDDFYTKGSLFAFQLDIEILKRTKGKTNLFDVMQKLQKRYSPEKPFKPENFIQEFSDAAGVDLHDFIITHTASRKKTNYYKLIEEIGFSKQKSDSTIWSYEIKKTHNISNFKKNRVEIRVFGSKFNKVHGSKLNIYEIDGQPVSWFNEHLLFRPASGKERMFKAQTKSGDIEFRMKPDLVQKKNIHLSWVKNKNLESEIAGWFWNK